MRRIRETVIDDDAPDITKYDHWEGQRLHSWVLIREGKRDLQETFFVEPTTGRKYSTKDSPYYTVDSIFNDKNFWINLKREEDIKRINLRFDDVLEWEYVMLKTQDKKVKESDGEIIDEEQDMSEDEDEDSTKLPPEVLDMPPPWPPKLFVDPDQFQNLCPLGEKTVFYKKVKVDSYSDYTQVDGLVKRITFYSDYRRHIIVEIRSFYKHRRDKLILRRRFPYEFKLIEEYAPSKDTHYWKKLIQIDGRSRLIYFYHHRNNDGLISREELIGRKTIERYKNREDKLAYRSVIINPDIKKEGHHLTIVDTHCGEKVIAKMKQKYELDKSKNVEGQIAKTEFNLAKSEVRVSYHYKEGKITANEEVFSRDELLGVARNGDMHEKETEEDAKQQKHQRILAIERECHAQIKAQESTHKKESEERKKSEDDIQNARTSNEAEDVFKLILEKSLHDKAREKVSKTGYQKKEPDTNKEQEKDYLAPILEKLGYLNMELNDDQAIEVKNEALKRLKERLLTRAEIIQKRLDNETHALEVAYQEYMRKGDNVKPEEEQEYDEKVQTINFRIDILTERAMQHYRDSLKKFEELDNRLSEDSRLAVLYRKR